MIRDDENKFDMDWWATADLEGIRERDIPGYMRLLGTQHYWTLGAKPDMDMLARARLNMEKAAARARRADAEAERRKLLAIAAAAASLAGLLWAMVRLWGD